MKRSFCLGRIFSMIVASISFAAVAAAQQPNNIDSIHSFRLIRSHSTLEQTGGIAGIHLSYDLFGRFDIVTGYEPSPLLIYPPIYYPFARFEDVRVFAFNNHPAVDAFPFPLARLIDLEELRGTFKPGEPRQLVFRGEDQQGQPFHLLAVQRGRLLHMVGASREQCCDFFQYKLDALAHIAPFADFNLDGIVDHADSNQLLANIGTLADASFEQGDADGDGDVDGDDFLTWQQQIGTAVSPADLAADSLDAASLTAAEIPEPAALVQLLSFAALLASYRRRHRG